MIHRLSRAGHADPGGFTPAAAALLLRAADRADRVERAERAIDARAAFAGDEKSFSRYLSKLMPKDDRADVGSRVRNPQPSPPGLSD